MAQYVRENNGELRQVSRYDTRLMMSPKDIFPSNKEEAAKYIVKKDPTQLGKPSKWYKVEDNSSLVRKIFRHCIKNIIDEVISGGCKFMLPNRTTASIYMGSLSKESVLHKCRTGSNHFDLLATNRTIPVLKYKKGKNTRRKELHVYVSPNKFKNIVDRANTGKIFSQRPRTLDYFLPKIYEEFNYISEYHIRRLLLYCFRRMSYHLKRDEELRFVDKEGEIRFYRLLGEHHDEVMRGVVNKRKARDRKIKENERSVN
jgi:hypothetical protein